MSDQQPYIMYQGIIHQMGGSCILILSWLKLISRIDGLPDPGTISFQATHACRFQRPGVESLGGFRIGAVFHKPLWIATMDRIAFEELVDEALGSLPDEIQAWLDNVVVIVGEWPTPDQLEQAGLARGDLLLGLYVGVPKTRRGFTYGESVPDKIVIFRQSILRICRTPDQIRDQVRKTVLHEIGHHFGLDEGQLRSAGV